MSSSSLKQHPTVEEMHRGGEESGDESEASSQAGSDASGARVGGIDDDEQRYDDIQRPDGILSEYPE